MGQRRAGDGKGQRGRACVWLLMLVVAVASTSGCREEEPKEKQITAWDRVRVEDARWDVIDGKNIHEFTLVNSNDLAVKNVMVRFHYLDSSDTTVATAEQTFPEKLRAHDAIRKGGIDTGPTSSRATRVRYEVVKARTILMGGQN